MPYACKPSCAQDSHAQHTALIHPGVLCLFYRGASKASLAGAAELALVFTQASECLDMCPMAGVPRSARQPWRRPGWCHVAARPTATTTSSSSPTTGIPPSSPSICRSRLCRHSLSLLHPAAALGSCSARTACRIELTDGALPHIGSQLAAHGHTSSNTSEEWLMRLLRRPGLSCSPSRRGLVFL